MEFETILLKKLIYDPAFFNHVLSQIEPSYFKTIGDSNTFKLLQEYFIEFRKPPSTTELVVKIKNVPNAEIRKAIAESIQNIKTVELTEIDNFDFMVDETLKWIKESLYYQALELGAKGLQEHNEELQLKAQEILDKRAKVTFGDLNCLRFRDTDKMIEYFQTKNIGLLTALKSINHRIGTGFTPGTLNVILAPAGIGKSMMMTDMATGFIKQGKNCLFVSLEMSDYETMKRVYANALDIDINRFKELSYSEVEIQELKKLGDVVSADLIKSRFNSLEMSGTLGNLDLVDYPAGSFSASQLQDLIEKAENVYGYKYDAVFVDYLGIMKSDARSKNTSLYEYVKSIGEEVRAVAKIMGKALFSCSQLNRSAYGKTSAGNETIADSIGTAMTADFLMMLLQTDEMKQSAEISVHIPKNRYTGITDTFTLSVDYEKMRFLDLASDVKPKDFSKLEITKNEPIKNTFDEIENVKPQEVKVSQSAQSVQNTQSIQKPSEPKSNPFDDMSIDDILNDI